MRIATAEQMREMDRAAIQERGIASTDLMERAAEAVAGEVMTLMGDVPGRVVCFCGPGNNGGDGVSCARQLLEAGFEVRCVLVGSHEKMTPDTRYMEARLAAAGGRVEPFRPDDAAFAAWCLECGAMVDAIFGTGLHRPVEGDALTAIHMMNTCEIPVVSADLPSGVETDTGRVLGAAVEAAVTVTFTLPKAGHFVGKGGLHTGRLVVADIGIPEDLVREVDCPVRSVHGSDIRLSRRRGDAHKGDFGKCYILGGSVGYTGAPVLAARAAVRSGAGLVTVGVPAPVWPVAAAKLEEAMPYPLPAGKEGQLSLDAGEAIHSRLDSCGVCLIGPGLGRGNGVAAVVRHLLGELHVPVVLDADGINALEGHIDVLDGRKGLHTILTPHDGEFARLGGDLSGGDRLGAARSFAVEHGCCLVLKGHGTITAFPDGTAYINTTGNPGMAKGGSGDVLAGLILSLLGQGLPARQAVPAAVWLHGAAGDVCASEIGEYGMTPSDLVSALPRVIREQME
ncbi:NAD(P)H-hydrate dehydratase [uncultured Flavonifractor sp.]|uniref:NAD(P)H-hydrate dehydratase n=1 Tax=uncultured Flavonifractor sp. TaxID=1193534 RepID=UPI002612BE2A|nr:NAD(P)H-hydrate dehydratase [uncultured Flavonifractor sp.]